MDPFFSIRLLEADTSRAENASLCGALLSLADRLETRLTTFIEQEEAERARYMNTCVESVYRRVVAEERARIESVRALARMVKHATGGDELRALVHRSLIAIDRVTSRRARNDELTPVIHA